MKKIKVQTHAAANSYEFKAGCPGQWPRIEETVSEDYKLTEKDVQMGCILETVEQWDSRRKAWLAAWETWVGSRKTTEETQHTTRQSEILDVINGLDQIRSSSGTLTGAQLSNAVRLIARVLVWLLKNSNARDLFHE